MGPQYVWGGKNGRHAKFLLGMNLMSSIRIGLRKDLRDWGVGLWNRAFRLFNNVYGGMGGHRRLGEVYYAIVYVNKAKKALRKEDDKLPTLQEQ